MIVEELFSQVTLIKPDPTVINFRPTMAKPKEVISFIGRMCFYHIWEWRPSWSCDLDHLYKLSFPFPKEAPHDFCFHKHNYSVNLVLYCKFSPLNDFW